MPAPRIRVLCVDDHRIVREGIALLIGRQPDIEVVGLAARGEEAVSLYRQYRPDVTLMDLRLRTMSGVDAIRAIRQEDPDARVIVLTMYEGHEDVYRALRAGAVAYLLKNVRSSELVQTIRDVHAGKRPIGADIEQRLAERAARPALTPREITVMEFLAQGMRNKEIAASLGLREGTVQVHLKNILVKLGVHDRTAAVAVALRHGIVHVE